MAGKHDKKPGDDVPAALSKQLDEAIENHCDADRGPTKQARDCEVDQAYELTKLARRAISEKTQQAWEATKTLTAPVVDVYKRADGEEGTQLRKYLGAVRKSLNEQIFTAQMQLQESKMIAYDQMVPIKDVLAAAQQQLVKTNGFRREQPEIAAAGLVMLVGVPSLLLRGKWSAVRLSVLAVGASAATCYGLDKWADKKRK